MSKPLTEKQWLASKLVAPLLAHVRDTKLANKRKLRLFAVACCRANWPHIGTVLQGVVEVAEQYAEGRTDAHARGRALDAGSSEVGRVCVALGRDYHWEVRRAPA